MDYYNQLDKTLEKVIHALKVMLYSKDEKVFEKIDFENDEIFLEPLLYTFVNQKEDFWFNSITLSNQDIDNGIIEVVTNDKGIIYLPGIGYLITEQPNASITLKVEKKKEYILFSRKEEIDFQKEELIFLDCGIELMTHYHPLFDRIFKDELKVSTPIEVSNDIALKHFESINIAFKIIELHNNLFYKAILKNLNKIMIYRGEKPYSFASLSAHNMIFLKTKIMDSEVFFIEHIIHEGSHVLFNTLTFESKIELFNVPYNTPIKEVTGIHWEHGDVYSRFHGLFTFSEIAKMLHLCYVQNIFKNTKEHELKGRLLVILKRYKVQLESFLNIKNLFTEEGEKWMNSFLSTFEKLKYIIPTLEEEISIEEQPYDFDYDIFLKKNPL